MHPFGRAWLSLCLVGGMISAISAAVLATLPHDALLKIQKEFRPASQGPSTFGTMPSDVVDRMKIVGPHDRPTPVLEARPEPDRLVAVRRPIRVVVLIDGGRRTLMTTAATVDDLINDATMGLAVGPRDRVYPATETALLPGATVKIVRIETRIIAKRSRIPYARVSNSDATLPRGLIRVVRAGRAGTRMRRIAITTADGAVIHRQDVGTETIAPPQDEITQVGTRREFAARGEFQGKEIIHMEATGYAPWTGEGVNDITAIGLKAQYGVVAVDPRVIPLRSIVFVEGYGRAIAGDTGGAIKGHRIDLCYNTAREALKYGRRPVRVYILSTPPPRKPRVARTAG